MRVLLLSRYTRQGASSRVRSLQYLPALAAAGIEVQVAPLLDAPYLANLYAGRATDWPHVAARYLARLRQLATARRYDLLWVEKELFPLLPAGAERLLTRLRIPYVVDYDDAVFHNYDRHRRPLVRRLLGGKIDVVMARARCVLAGNDYLAARAQAAGARRVVALPTVVDLERYPPPAAATRAAGPLRIGWIGTPATAGYLQAAAPALGAAVADGAALVLIGAPPGTLADHGAECRPWQEAEEVAQITRFDIGIMPLPDAPFERGKCGYKLIQYMACGVPCVASPVGVNRALLASGAGLLAADPAQWHEALGRLLAEPALRARAGHIGRAQVEDHYSLQAQAPTLIAALREAAE